MYFINTIRHQVPNEKHVSHIYRNLLLGTLDNAFHLKNKWELGLNVIIEDGEWETMCTGCPKGINSNMWKEFDWQMNTRFFKTRSVVSKFVDEPAALSCWRECGMVGDHSHIFWDCPKLLSFWKGVKSAIDTIMGIDLLFSPSQFLFDLTADDTYTRDQKHLLHILLMTARNMVTIKWRNLQPPTVAQWKQRLREVYGMEAFTAQLQLQTDVFKRRWLPIARYPSN